MMVAKLHKHTFKGIPVSAEMLALISKGKAAVTSAYEVIAQICEQGKKDHMPNTNIRALVYGIFGDSFSERHLRRMMPLGVKNINMIRLQQQKVAVFADTDKIDMSAKEERELVIECNTCKRKILNSIHLDWMMDPKLMPESIRHIPVGQQYPDGYRCDICGYLQNIQFILDRLWTKYDKNKDSEQDRDKDFETLLRNISHLINLRQQHKY